MPLAVGPTSGMSDPDEDLRARVHDEDVLGVARTGLLQRCTEKKGIRLLGRCVVLARVGDLNLPLRHCALLAQSSAPTESAVGKEGG